MKLFNENKVNNRIEKAKKIGKGRIDRRSVKSIIIKLHETSQLSYRELEILNDLKAIERNGNVPSNYIIYEFYNSKGEGFEAGVTPNGVGITN